MLKLLRFLKRRKPVDEVARQAGGVDWFGFGFEPLVSVENSGRETRLWRRNRTDRFTSTSTKKKMKQQIKIVICLWNRNPPHPARPTWPRSPRSPPPPGADAAAGPRRPRRPRPAAADPPPRRRTSRNRFASALAGGGGVRGRQGT